MALRSRSETPAPVAVALSGPTPESDRLLSLDILRGVAVLGILAMNIGAFSMPAAAYFDPTAYGDLTGANRWIWLMTHLLVDMKFMAIFAMLFGAGIVLLTERAEARGGSPANLHLRRMAWLMVFGLLHAYLLWYDDVLFWYGLCGVIVYRFRKHEPRKLIAWGVGAMAVASLFMLAGGMTTHLWPSAMMEHIVEDLKPSAAAIARELEAYRGGWIDQMSCRMPQALEMHTSTFGSWAIWRVSGLMLLGMGLFRLRVFQGARQAGFYQALIAAAAIPGLPLIIYGVYWNFAIGWKAPEFFFLGLQFNYWASIPVSLGWVGLVMLACQRPNLARFLRPVAAVGRMAFTNYILQTVICTTLFYGHGLGWFGQVERTGQALVIVSVWTLQLIHSPLWLHRFRYGPIEWLWRSLVYLRPQPLRRGPVLPA